ncbi:MAG: helix-turn-helix domain-containing protein [Vampirovibrio sp.]|nr:helix-turn-helix domain-containing protein [Vampirovibrio sp.]
MLSQYIASKRQERHLSQRDLARKAGISSATVSKIESGKIKNVGIDTLHDIAYALDVTLVDMMMEYGPLDDEQVRLMPEETVQKLSRRSRKLVQDLVYVLSDFENVQPLRAMSPLLRKDGMVQKDIGR